MERLERIASAFMESKVLLTAAELRVFERLKGRGATAAEVAVSVEGDLRGVEILLDALVAMGILVKEAAVYRNHPEYEQHLIEDSPGHFAAMLRHRNLMFRNWALIEDRIRGVAPAPPAGRRPQLSERAANENFIRAMYAGGRRNVRGVADRIDLEGVRVLADLGGGPGHYLVEFARRSPRIEPYLVDLPVTLEVAERLLEESPVRSRVKLVPWDFYQDPAPERMPACDLVFISQVVHSESPERNRLMFHRLLPVVMPGGRVVIHENVVEPGRTEPAAAALFAVNMLAMTDAGRTYTEAEIVGWAREAGFDRDGAERVNERSYLVFFRRPV